MRLYRMELYKLFKRKIFLAGAVLAVAILLIYFWYVEVGEEIATVDGKTYEGYAAVQMNRGITEEFEGRLTDDKVKDIVKKYGFPHVVKEGYTGFRDSNYLNGFVTEYLSDGYLRDWDNYKIPTMVYPIAETELGDIQQITGRDIILSYTTGWNVFFKVFQMGMVLASILIIFAVSVVFADESQTKMLQLIFTTEEGKRVDIGAKIAAAFTLTTIVYLGILGLDFLLCGSVFGLDGADCPVSMIMANQYLNAARPETYMPVSNFLIITLLLDFLAVSVLCAVTLCISSHFGNCFHAVGISAVCWGAPVLIRMLFSGFANLFVSGMPVFLIMINNTLDMMALGFFGMISVTFAVGVMVMCIVNGHCSYKNFQAGN